MWLIFPLRTSDFMMLWEVLKVGFLVNLRLHVTPQEIQGSSLWIGHLQEIGFLGMSCYQHKAVKRAGKTETSPSFYINCTFNAWDRLEISNKIDFQLMGDPLTFLYLQGQWPSSLLFLKRHVLSFLVKHFIEHLQCKTNSVETSSDLSNFYGLKGLFTILSNN